MCQNFLSVLPGGGGHLESDVYDIEYPGGKHVVISQHVNVGSVVAFDVQEIPIKFAYIITWLGEEDGTNVDDMVQVVLQFIDGVREVDFLPSKAADVISINVPSSIQSLELECNGICCVQQHASGLSGD